MSGSDEALMNPNMLQKNHPVCDIIAANLCDVCDVIAAITALTASWIIN